MFILSSLQQHVQKPAGHSCPLHHSKQATPLFNCCNFKGQQKDGAVILYLTMPVLPHTPNNTGVCLQSTAPIQPWRFVTRFHGALPIVSH